MDAVKSRFIDCMKCIGIISVVAGHLVDQPFNMYSPYTFHMPLFFFLGGMLYNEGKSFYSLSRSIFNRHFKYIITTYIITGIIGQVIYYKYGIFLGNIFNSNPISTVYYALQGNMHTNLLFLTAWFLLAYCLVSLIFGIVINLSNKINKKHGPTIVLSLTLIFCIYASSLILDYITKSFTQYLNVLMQVLFGGVFFILGYIFRNKIVLLMNHFLFMLSFLLLLYLVNTGNVQPFTMAWSKYPTGVLMQSLGAVLCIHGLAFISYALAKSNLIGPLFLYIGRNSRSIMSYHICVFVFLDIAFFKLGLFDIKYATIENHFINSKTWTLYFFFGVIIPILFRYLFEISKPISNFNR